MEPQPTLPNPPSALSRRLSVVAARERAADLTTEIFLAAVDSAHSYRPRRGAPRTCGGSLEEMNRVIEEEAAERGIKPIGPAASPGGGRRLSRITAPRRSERR